MVDATWYIIYIGDSRRIPSVNSIFSASKIPFTIWIPVQNALQQFRGKSIVKAKPIFPGYIFIKFVYETAGMDDKLQALGGYFLRGPGSAKPTPIPDEYIKEVKEMESAKSVKDLFENTFDFNIGDMVEVTNGPFLGGQGPIKEIKRTKIRVELDIMKRPVEVELNPRQVSKVSKVINA